MSRIVGYVGFPLFSVLLIVALLAVARIRPKDEAGRWVHLSVVAVLLFAAILVYMAVIPSWWIYTADSTLKWKSPYFIDTTGGHFKLHWGSGQIRDVVVLIWYGVAIGGFGLGIRVYNRRNPKVLPPGEEKREATGGYK